MIRVIPVIDLKGGEVVRGMAGRRSEYQPIRSRLCPGSDPLRIARAFRDIFGLTELYVADLDALAGSPPALPLLRSLNADGFQLLVDAGVRSAGDVQPLLDSGVKGIVTAMETLPGLGALEAVLAQVGVERTVFSLDLKCGVLMNSWGAATPEAIGRQVFKLGLRRLIVLDLAHVGGAQGPGANVLALCAELRNACPEAEIISGGGVRDVEDLIRLAHHGVTAALVASALHDGRIGPAQLGELIPLTPNPSPAAGRGETHARHS